MTPALPASEYASPWSGTQSGGTELSVFLFSVLDPKAAAEYLHVSESTVVEEAEKGRLPGRKIGPDWRFLRLALVDWLRAERQPGREEVSAATAAGAELAEHIRRTGIPWTPEAEREAEQFIATVSGVRKTGAAVR